MAWANPDPCILPQALQLPPGVAKSPCQAHDHPQLWPLGPRWQRICWPPVLIPGWALRPGGAQLLALSPAWRVGTWRAHYLPCAYPTWGGGAQWGTLSTWLLLGWPGVLWPEGHPGSHHPSKRMTWLVPTTMFTITRIHGLILLNWHVLILLGLSILFYWD